LLEVAVSNWADIQTDCRLLLRRAPRNSPFPSSHGHVRMDMFSRSQKSAYNVGANASHMLRLGCDYVACGGLAVARQVVPRFPTTWSCRVFLPRGHQSITKRTRRHPLQSGVWRISANSHVSEALSLSLSPKSCVAAVPLTLACGPLASLHAHHCSRGRTSTIQ
jgi:hypothetical protein